MLRKDELLSEDFFNNTPEPEVVDVEAYQSLETYTKLFKIENVVMQHYEAGLHDLQTLMTLISSARVEVKYLGVLCLRQLMHKFSCEL